MAMKKAEMEAHHAEYHDHMKRSQAARAQGLYRQGIRLAMEAWEHIDGMMQYERKYEDQDTVTIEAVETVLNDAPLLFETQSIDAAEAFLRANPRIAKKAAGDLPEKLAAAKRLMWEAHRIWDYLEEHHDCELTELEKTIGGDRHTLRRISKAWEQMRLLSREPCGTSHRLQLLTRLGQIVRGKCHSCGAIAEAPKACFLEPMRCPECHGKSWFVILAGSST